MTAKVVLAEEPYALAEKHGLLDEKLACQNIAQKRNYC